MQRTDKDNLANVAPRAPWFWNLPFDPQSTVDRLSLGIGNYLLVNAAFWLQDALDAGERPFDEDGALTQEGFDVMVNAIHFFSEDDDAFGSVLYATRRDMMDSLGPF